MEFLFDSLPIKKIIFFLFVKDRSTFYFQTFEILKKKFSNLVFFFVFSSQQLKNLQNEVRSTHFSVISNLRNLERDVSSLKRCCNRIEQNIENGKPETTSQHRKKIFWKFSSALHKKSENFSVVWFLDTSWKTSRSTSTNCVCCLFFNTFGVFFEKVFVNCLLLRLKISLCCVFLVFSLLLHLCNTSIIIVFMFKIANIVNISDTNLIIIFIPITKFCRKCTFWL